MHVLYYQVVELDFLYPSEGIHRRWENGYRITSTAATADQAAFILSAHKKKSTDVAQETLRTSAFPVSHVKVHLANLHDSLMSRQLFYSNQFKFYLFIYLFWVCFE